MATIVLVPGAGLGGWAWSRVTPALKAAGHVVRPVTLRGLGTDDRADATAGGHRAEDRSADASAIDLTAHSRELAELLKRENLRDVVLVGHSHSGLVIGAAAELVPDRIARLVFLDAAVPEDGVSAFAAGGPEYEEAMTAAAAAAGDPTRVPWLPDAELDAYFPGHDLSADDLAWIRENAAGHPIAAFREAPRIASRAAAALPRTYVTCARRAYPSPVDDTTPGWDHVTLDAGHWPMVTEPEATAAALDRIARG